MNTGWIGMIVYLLRLSETRNLVTTECDGSVLKVCIATLFFLFYISVSELFLPTTWMFLGIAYWYMDKARDERAVMQYQGCGRLERISRWRTARELPPQLE